MARADAAGKQNYLVDFTTPYRPDSQRSRLALIYSVTVFNCQRRVVRYHQPPCRRNPRAVVERTRPVARPVTTNKTQRRRVARDATRRHKLSDLTACLGGAAVMITVGRFRRGCKIKNGRFADRCMTTPNRRSPPAQPVARAPSVRG